MRNVMRCHKEMNTLVDGFTRAVFETFLSKNQETGCLFSSQQFYLVGSKVEGHGIIR